MKHTLTICRTTYIKWLLNTKMLVLLLAGIFMYIYCIEPMEHYASILGSPLNVVEPFISVTNCTFFAPLMPILFLFLVSDEPRLDQSSLFILFRTGRKKWFCGQLMFIILAGFTYLLIIFIISIIFIAKDSFVANGWSIAVRQIHEPEYRELFEQSGLSQIELSVLNQFRPFTALIYSFLSMWGYMTATGAIMLLFTLNGQKLIGIFLNVIVNGISLLMFSSEFSAKWLLPPTHVILARHYDDSMNITFLDIKYSLIYDAVLLICTIWLAYRRAKKCSFHIIDGTEG